MVINGKILYRGPHWMLKTNWICWRAIRGEMDLFIDVTSKIASSALVEQKRTHYTAPPFLKNKKMSFSWLDTHFDLWASGNGILSVRRMLFVDFVFEKKKRDFRSYKGGALAAKLPVKSGLRLGGTCWHNKILTEPFYTSLRFLASLPQWKLTTTDSRTCTSVELLLGRLLRTGGQADGSRERKRG